MEDNKHSYQVHAGYLTNVVSSSLLSIALLSTIWFTVFFYLFPNIGWFLGCKEHVFYSFLHAKNLAESLEHSRYTMSEEWNKAIHRHTMEGGVIIQCSEMDRQTDDGWEERCVSRWRHRWAYGGMTGDKGRVEGWRANENLWRKFWKDLLVIPFGPKQTTP